MKEVDVKSIIERIENGQFWQFHGGIHPPEMKFLTTDKPIRPLSTPSELTLPIQQHIGDPGDLLVSVGDKVLKGQALTQATAPLSVPIHAPTSGVISAIENATIAHPSGLSELCIKLTPDGEDKWRQRNINSHYQELPKEQLIEKIAQAGISGMGGAGFPTHVKVGTAAQINYLIINAAECEPYITADDLLIREHCAEIVDGINILDHILAPAFILIGIEDNKPEAIQALKKATDNNDKIKVCVLPTKYPTGGEKQLINALTGLEVPAGVLPSSLGIVMQNIATCYAIADAIIYDTPLIKRVVTISGQALDKPQNVWALLGTPIEFLLSQCSYNVPETKHIIMGGPMMGFSLPDTKVPVVKTTNCVLAPSEKEISTTNKEVECIRCGQCAEVCPSQLLPQELQWSAKAKDQQQLEALNLFDCIECGACAYVCPSHIPLVHYYRIAKAEIRQQKLLDIKAEKAKKRFEARKARLEREKIAREEKHKKAAEARKARMNSGTAEANKEKSAVAAALARVKAKKAQANLADTSVKGETPTADKNSQVAAAVARAKAKKLAAQQQNNAEELPDENNAEPNNALKNENTATAQSKDKKSAVAAAVAKAKAKKLAAQQQENSEALPEENNTEPNNAVENENTTAAKTKDKKPAVAAAVAKAKAKKLAAQQQEAAQEIQNDANATLEQTSGKLDSTEELKSKPEDNRKAKIAAAVAKAKANKQQKEATQTEENNSNSLDKKARIAAAVAKAKAKKQQTESN